MRSVESRGAISLSDIPSCMILIALMIALFSGMISIGWTQVSEEAIDIQAEVGGGYMHGGGGGYGAFAVGAELHPAYQLSARYQLEIDSVYQTLAHRPLVELRVQLNVFEVIPWVSVTAGASYGIDEIAFTAGGALGADLRLDAVQFLSFSARFAHPAVWTLGVAFGRRWVLNDPFDQ
jgi:hypothetical protein